MKTVATYTEAKMSFFVKYKLHYKFFDCSASDWTDKNRYFYCKHDCAILIRANPILVFKTNTDILWFKNQINQLLLMLIVINQQIADIG